jgi:hypothetical protein
MSEESAIIPRIEKIIKEEKNPFSSPSLPLAEEVLSISLINGCVLVVACVI